MMTAIRILLIFLSVAASGCVAHLADESERAASIAPHTSRRIHGENLEEFLVRRSAVIIAAEQLTMSQPIAGDRGYTGRFDLNAGNSKFFKCATATAIDARGYFLTASHNLEGNSPYLIFYQGGAVKFASARIVWRGDYLHGQPDLALLHIPVRLQSTFRWAGRMPNSDLAFAAGLNSQQRTQFKLVCISGSLGRIIERRKPAPGYTTILHDAPLHAGDSGGPLMASNGQLLGINVEIHPQLPIFPHRNRQHSAAHRPNIEWLRSVIAADQRTRFPRSPRNLTSKQTAAAHSR